LAGTRWLLARQDSQEVATEGVNRVVSVSVVVLLAIVLILYIRNKQLKLSHAILAALFGLSLAGTGIAGPVSSVINSAVQMLNNLTA
jgi:hypothetical protein